MRYHNIALISLCRALLARLSLAEGFAGGARPAASMPKKDAVSIPAESLVPLGTKPSPVWPDARVPLGERCTSWRVDLVESVDPDVYQPPRTLHVRCPMHGLHGRHLGTTLTFSNLLEETTVWELKAAVDERLMVRPEQMVRLLSWGRELEDDAKTLAEYFVADKTRLEMQLTTRQPPGERELRRVRVTSTLLQTRQLLVDPKTTVIELKRKVEAAILKGQHEWWSEDGLRHTVCDGCTWLVVSTVKADPKTPDLSAVRIGDEGTLGFASPHPHPRLYPHHCPHLRPCPHLHPVALTLILTLTR